MLPNSTMEMHHFEISSNIKLSDPNFNESNDIDIFIGTTLFWYILCVGQIKQSNGTVLQETKFCWIISGQLNLLHFNQTFAFLTSSNLNEELQLFWKMTNLLAKSIFLRLRNNIVNHFLNELQEEIPRENS